MPLSRRRPGFWAALVLVATITLASCTEESNPAAPYLGQRDLEFLKVTRSFTPDLQWVGGRVAAVGINRGDRAALDSTLVWIRTATDNSISSVVTMGPDFDRAFVESVGGTPQERVSDGETYTFWIAEAAAFQAGLDPVRFEPSAFADTTLTFRLVMLGQSGGDPNLGVQFSVTVDESLTAGIRYILSWTPEHIRFRQIAVRRATAGGWTNLVWHIRVPQDQPASLTPPLIIGQAPEGTQEIVEFPETGFEPTVHTVWGATDAWNESFAASATGYAWLRLLAANFQN
jgi:hypothetical protein